MHGNLRRGSVGNSIYPNGRQLTKYKLDWRSFHAHNSFSTTRFRQGYWEYLSTNPWTWINLRIWFPLRIHITIAQRIRACLISTSILTNFLCLLLMVNEGRTFDISFLRTLATMLHRYEYESPDHLIVKIRCPYPYHQSFSPFYTNECTGLDIIISLPFSPSLNCPLIHRFLYQPS